MEPRPAGSEAGDDTSVDGSRTLAAAVVEKLKVTHACADVHDAAVIPPSGDHVAPPFVLTMLLLLLNARQVAGATQVTPE